MMAIKYVRKSEQQTWDSSTIENAIEVVKNDKMPFSTAGKQFNVPSNILKRRVIGKNRDAVDGKTVMGSLRSMFNQEQEILLAEGNKTPHRFNKESKMAGKDRVECFREQYPNISLRKTESTLMARAQAFNKSKNSKVFVLKGRCQVGIITSAERELLSTFEVCMSAGGNFIPPFVIFPRQRMKNELKDGAPPGIDFAWRPSSTLLGESFLRVATPMTAINGFRKCGILPLGPNMFSDEDYTAAEVTDIPLDLEKNLLCLLQVVAPFST
ncbi:hypothetical protein PR048_005608 [Dryococelus australis]|uniref:HTH psq-type domain-containing protein n=1 Tax=Dryococelus australis TaxID=614101 RepID=A0ABQ9I8L9_9NEOP|nr:hypothetical protein PR048_005608 [Dryococelus australis]